MRRYASGETSAERQRAFQISPVAPPAGVVRPHGLLTIQHAAGVAQAMFEAVFGLHEPGEIAGSWAEAAGLGPLITYAHNSGAYRVYCQPVTTTRLDVFVEPGTDSTAAACDSVWSEMQRALKTLRPECKTAELYEGSGFRPVGEGRVGFRYQAWRREVAVPSFIGAGSAVLGISLAGNNPAPLVASVPGIANGIWWFGTAVNDWRTKRIRWK